MKRKDQRLTAAVAWLLKTATRTKPVPVPREHRTAIRHMAHHGMIVARTVMLDVGTQTRPRSLARYHASPL